MGPLAAQVQLSTCVAGSDKGILRQSVLHNSRASKAQPFYSGIVALENHHSAAAQSGGEHAHHLHLTTGRAPFTSAHSVSQSDADKSHPSCCHGPKPKRVYGANNGARPCAQSAEHRPPTTCPRRRALVNDADTTGQMSRSGTSNQLPPPLLSPRTSSQQTLPPPKTACVNVGAHLRRDPEMKQIVQLSILAS
jgi:hypothetical protein